MGDDDRYKATRIKFLVDLLKVCDEYERQNLIQELHKLEDKKPMENQSNG